ncbi:MAG: hypothetical protein IJX19_07480, partial [Clostridia bacterium]|nr:hypothetical protein [Clostridia bacterium]
TTLLLALAMLLLSSCNTAPPESEETATTQSSTEADEFDEIVNIQIAGCFSKGEYLDFLNSEQCPSDFYISLSAFKDYGSLEQFYLHYNKVTEILTGQYHFERNGIKTVAWVRIGNELTDWWSAPFFEEISDENMPENLVLGKDISMYWIDVLKAAVDAGEIEDPSNGSEPYDTMKGNYYPITENVRAFYDGRDLDLDDLFDYCRGDGYGPVIHLYMDATTQVWIAPQRLDREMTSTKMYEIFREASPLMDRLLTKSTSKAAAEELYNLWKDALK